MNAMTAALSAALIHFVWQGTVMGVLLWIALFALRNRSANARYLAACATLVVLMMLPVVTVATFYCRAVPSVSSARWVGEISQTVASSWNRTLTQSSSWPALLQAWVLPAWSLGVVLCSIRPLLGWKHAFSLGRRGNPADESTM